MRQRRGQDGRRGSAPAATAVAASGDDAAPPGLQRLDPARVRMRRGLAGDLQATVEGDRSYLRAQVLRAFPLTGPAGWVSLRDAEGTEVGLLDGLAGLDEASRRLVEEDLRLRYFTPRVTAIVDLRDELQGGRSGGVVWDLITDRGPARLHMPNTNDYIQLLGEQRLLLSDRVGQRFEIPDIQALDPLSRRLLGRYVWL